MGTAFIVGNSLDSASAALQQQIAARRVALLNRGGWDGNERVAALDKMKRQKPSAVMVLETLTKTLPDDTYLNELRIEGGNVEIAGLSGDATALIRLIEQSHKFTRATFVAPTTREPGKAGDSFQIAADIQPCFPVTQ